MTIRRDDLVAAAAVGLLQYRQIDPLLVFLLQRDVRAKRQALAAQVRENRHGGVYALLSYTVAVLAIVTAALFAVLFTSRAMHAIGSGAVIVFTGVYLAGALAIASWFRKRGYCGRVRMLAAVIMASVPLAVMALQQVAG
jgi:hypothetical protein